VLFRSGTAAHVGLLFLLIVVERWGLKALRDLRLWSFALVSLLAPTLWYLHAHSLWLEYGNSLGVSDEAHWISFDLLSRPLYFLGILKLEVFNVWMPAGAILIVLVLAYFRPFKRMRLLLLWGASLAAYYVVTVRSAAHDPLHYYHVVSVPMAALAFGFAVEFLRDLNLDRERLLRAASVSGVAVLALGVAGMLGASWQVLAAGTVALTIAVGLVSPRALSLDRKAGQGVTPATQFRNVMFAVCLALASMTLVTGVGLSLHRQLPSLRPHTFMACAKEFAIKSAPGDLILVSGGTCSHPAGGRAAYNSPYFLYWMGRKGFTICTQRQAVDEVERFRLRGARFFVAEKEQLAQRTGFARALRKRYSVVAECQVAIMFSLREAGTLPAGSSP
jgi:hypothetical protein